MSGDFSTADGGLPVDLVIPVYNEGENIVHTLAALARDVKTPIRVLICYDRDDDDTLDAIRRHGTFGLVIEFVKNQGYGAHGAVLTGFGATRSNYVVVYPADDDYNAIILDQMFRAAADGADIVCASRFIPGGTMEHCPWLKALLLRSAAWTLRYLGRLPTRDATNGFRLFSRRLLSHVEIESRAGFTYSLELIAKCYRLGWPIAEVPARWYERKSGASRFRVLRWAPAYLKWYFYVFATTYLRSGPDTVRLKNSG